MALTPERIDEIAESMPGGVEGFLKGWGWYQFARAIEAEARRDALEEAAKVCDAGAEQMLHAYKREGAGRCAAAIRKLKEDTQ